MGPKILYLDIETSPILTMAWGTFKQNIPLNMVLKKWSIISWAAKWDHEKKVIQQDIEGKNFYKDKPLLKRVWGLLNEADIVVTQNGIRFDIPRLNAAFIKNGMKPPSSFKHIDIYRLVKKHFGFVSNKLGEVAKELGCKNRKLTDRKFVGNELWIECYKGNRKAWKEMREYNPVDVLVLEEIYHKVIPWGSPVNFTIYHKGAVCSCGSKKFHKNGYSYSNQGRFDRYRCSKCGDELRDKVKNKTTNFVRVAR